MHSLRRYIAQYLTKRPGSRSLESTESLASDISASTSHYQRDTREFPFYLDPKLVASQRHESHPKHLPSPHASVNDVRYFLFTLLTSKTNKCAKMYPEWVLETCMNWSGSGRELHCLSDEELRNICPSQAVAVGIISCKHKIGNPCPPTARTMIGEVIATFVTQNKDKAAQKAELQRPWSKEIRRTPTMPTASFEGHFNVFDKETESQALDITSTSRSIERLQPHHTRDSITRKFGSFERVEPGYLQQPHSSGRAGVWLSAAGEGSRCPTNEFTSLGPSKAASIVSSISSLGPTDSISLRHSNSTGYTSPPCSTFEGFSGPTINSQERRRPHTWGASANPRRLENLPSDMQQFRQNLMEHRVQRKDGPHQDYRQVSQPRAVSSTISRNPITNRPSSLCRTSTMNENQRVLQRISEVQRRVDRFRTLYEFQQNNSHNVANCGRCSGGLTASVVASQDNCNKSMIQHLRHDSGSTTMTQLDLANEGPRNAYGNGFARPLLHQQQHQQLKAPLSRANSLQRDAIQYNTPRVVHHVSPYIYVEPSQWMARNRRNEKYSESIVNITSPQEIRSRNNFNIDSHALDQAEGLRHRGSVVAQHRAKMELQIAKSNQPGSLRRRFSTASAGARVEALRNTDAGDAGPAGYWDPVTRRYRSTLVNVIKDRQRYRKA